MGENIGDMGGVSLALDAYHASLRGDRHRSSKVWPATSGYSSGGRRYGARRFVTKRCGRGSSPIRTRRHDIEWTAWSETSTAGTRLSGSSPVTHSTSRRPIAWGSG